MKQLRETNNGYHVVVTMVRSRSVGALFNLRAVSSERVSEVIHTTSAKRAYKWYDATRRAIANNRQLPVTPF